MRKAIILAVLMGRLATIAGEARAAELLCDYFDPSKTSAPPRLGAETQITPFGCRREFRYQGRIRLIDSYHRQDAEQIRPIIAPVPEAVSELDEYQANRRSVRVCAYFGTLGILTGLTGVIFSREISEENSTAVRNLFALAGLLIVAISTGYALSLLSDNEEHVVNAVKNYNKAKPADPIELQFSANILSF